MEWGYKFTELQNQIKSLEEKANNLAEAYAEAEDFTLRFLKCCSKHHIKLVSIPKLVAKALAKFQKFIDLEAE